MKNSGKSPKMNVSMALLLVISMLALTACSKSDNTNSADGGTSSLEEEIAAFNAPSAEGKLYEESNAEFLFSEDGLSFQIAANKAALAYLRNDKEELSQYLADPSYDTGLSEDGSNLLDRLRYMVLKLPTNTAIEKDGVYYATYQFTVKDVEMIIYLDLGLIKTDNGWKVEYICLQG